ncbi:MAG: hypothetical protein J7K54_04905 [Candidatus Aenigmarchaeota archaeon]|nr:hypothetical protein [Candidatus Aenigmarchaeota archaeon]
MDSVYESRKLRRLLNGLGPSDEVVVTTGISPQTEESVYSWVTVYVNGKSRKFETYRLENPAVTQGNARNAATAEAVRFSGYIKNECRSKGASVMDADI